MVRTPGRWQRTRRNLMVGSLEQYPNETEAQKAVAALRADINAENPRTSLTPISVHTLVEHSREKELVSDCTKSRKTQVTYAGYFRKWILPRWGKPNRYQGDTGTPSPRLQPGHVGYIYPSRHSSEAASAEQRHSSSPGVYNGCWLRPVCWEVFLICACSKWRDRCENTAASMKCIRVDAESCSFFVPI